MPSLVVTVLVGMRPDLEFVPLEVEGPAVFGAVLEGGLDMVLSVCGPAEGWGEVV